MKSVLEPAPFLILLFDSGATGYRLPPLLTAFASESGVVNRFPEVSRVSVFLSTSRAKHLFLPWGHSFIGWADRIHGSYEPWNTFLIGSRISERWRGSVPRTREYVLSSREYDLMMIKKSEKTKRSRKILSKFRSQWNLFWSPRRFSFYFLIPGQRVTVSPLF